MWVVMKSPDVVACGSIHNEDVLRLIANYSVISERNRRSAGTVVVAKCFVLCGEEISKFYHV
jgi:hypothetical protein